MPCFRPITGYRSRIVNPNGKRSIVFNVREGFPELHVKLPCGRCIGCRLEKSRQNAIRAVHEASLYENNSFLTLTYSPEKLPEHGFINKAHPVKFMKDLRERVRQDLINKGLSKEEREAFAIRSYGCAEYGEKYGRPHYHICLFNYDFPDKYPYKKTKTGFTLFRSKLLEELWPYGHSDIGTLTFESAAYVARYVTKKITGPKAERHYEYIVPETGEILQRPPETPVCVSRRPGIGKPWLDKYTFSEVYPADSIVLRGIEMKPPKYYDRRYEIEYPSDYNLVRLERSFKSRAGCCGYKYCLHEGVNSTHARLLTREKVLELKFEKLERPYETQNVHSL